MSGNRQGQDRGLRLAQGLPAVRGPSRRAEERGAGRARHRCPRRRPAGAAGNHRAASREGRDPRRVDPRRRGPHAVGHRVPGPDQGGGLLHDGRRGLLARRDPGAGAGHPGGGRHRTAGAGHRRRHPGHPRRRQGHAADERHRGGGRPDPPAPGADTWHGGPSNSRTRTSRPTPRDGHHMEVVANIGGLDDARAAMAKGAEGVGLLRSEFVFLERRSAPSEDEQAEIYTATSPGRWRPASRWSSARWTSAATSRCPTCRSPRRRTRSSAMRGIRVGLDRPEILRTQVRAILRAVDAGASINVMFPMIATIEDFRLAKAIFEEERAALGVATGAGRDHGRGAVGRCDGRAVRRRGGLLLGRDERPHPVHPRHGPRSPQARATGGRPQPGRARADRAGRHGRARGRQVGRRLRWHRVRPAGRAASGRPRRRRAQRQRPGDPRRQGADPSCSLSRTARSWPPAPSPRTPPPRSAHWCRPTTTKH